MMRAAVKLWLRLIDRHRRRISRQYLHGSKAAESTANVSQKLSP
jgi:hypothetical protein